MKNKTNTQTDLATILAFLFLLWMGFSLTQTPKLPMQQAQAGSISSGVSETKSTVKPIPASNFKN